MGKKSEKKGTVKKNREKESRKKKESESVGWH